MVTGMTNLATDLSEKLIELLVEVAPKARRVGVLIDGNTLNRTEWLDAVPRSAARYSVEVSFAYPAKAEEIESAMTSLAKQGAQALVAIASPLVNNQRLRIITLAQAQRWPIVSWTRTWVEQGALISYGVDSVQSFRRAAYFVDRILKGAKPGDLPIEQPMTFELAVNMKTAKSLGLTIPPTILVRATDVIE
jgi:putative ABC transport system substrate-binding protein